MPIHEGHSITHLIATVATTGEAMSEHVFANLKAVVALVGMVATALLDQFTGSVVLTVIATVATVVGVWAAQNTPVE